MRFLRRLLAWLRLSRVESGSYQNRYGALQYKVYRPWLSRGKPLVVMLHGCNQNADDFAVGTRMNQLARRMGFIVAFPEQAVAAHASRCWNWSKAAHQERDEGEP